MVVVVVMLMLMVLVGDTDGDGDVSVVTHPPIHTPSVSIAVHGGQWHNTLHKSTTKVLQRSVG